jgi:glycosyltransferase involved in cell wall biosynthesis
MKPLSVVIICKNEEKIIGRTIKSVQGITNDIVCVDTGSTDNTISIIKTNGARVLEMHWEGYGKTKNKALAAAQHDWILMLDADEPVDDTLKQSILQLKLDDEKVVYSLSFRNYYAGKRIYFGEWGRRESHIRLFNRKVTSWNDVDIHEQVLIPIGVKVLPLKGYVQHYTADNYEEYMQKTINYAMLSGKKYFEEGKTPSYFKIYLSPLFSFLYNYFFRLGFLDGREGFLIARTTAIYTFLKYSKLRELCQR